METIEPINDTIFSIADFMPVIEKKESKFSFEFQELCSEIEKYIGKSAWTLPYKVGFTEYKIRRAFEIAKQKEKVTMPYIIGIIKRLP